MFIVFGGSFDPVHIGHIVIARDVREEMGAEEVLFVPAHHAPLKEGHRASPEDRLRMLEIALDGEEGFSIEDYEIKKGGISYTVDTLRYLREKRGDDPYLLLGADSVLKFHLWREPESIVQMAKLIVVDRGGKLGEVRNYISERFSSLKEGENLFLLKVRRVDISATEIRERIAHGKSIYCLVPEGVRNYRERKGLYGFMGRSPQSS